MGEVEVGIVESIEVIWEILMRLGRGEDSGEVGLVVVDIFVGL
jgi:hypothetical protein